VGYDLAYHYLACAAATATMVESVRPMAEIESVDDADVVVVAFGTPARYIKAAVRTLRADGHAVGFVRPVTLFPFPDEIVARAAEGARVVAVYETNQGQMVDDVRLAVLGRADVRFIGGLSIDGSGFGIAPDLDTRRLRARIESLVSG
jgi:2-oxoglutarate ferredoxin oxidoreductase subunit alpha